MISETIVGVIIGGTLGLVPYFIQLYINNKQRKEDLKQKRIDAAHEYFRGLYNYLAPILKGCFYASLYSRQVKDNPNELSEEDKAEYSERIRKLRENWNNALNNFAEAGYFGLFPDKFYNKVVNVNSKIVNWHLIIEKDPSLLNKWNELKEIEREIRKVTTELREEIRELLNVSAI